MILPWIAMPTEAVTKGSFAKQLVKTYKIAGVQPAKENLVHMISWNFLETFRSSFHIKHMPTSASMACTIT